MKACCLYSCFFLLCFLCHLLNWRITESGHVSTSIRCKLFSGTDKWWISWCVGATHSNKMTYLSLLFSNLLDCSLSFVRNGGGWPDASGRLVCNDPKILRTRLRMYCSSKGLKTKVNNQLWKDSCWSCLMLNNLDFLFVLWLVKTRFGHNPLIIQIKWYQCYMLFTAWRRPAISGWNIAIYTL